MTKKFTFLILVISISNSLSGQSVKVKTEEAKISGENIEGFAVDLDDIAKDVNTSFIKYLKTLGKVKQNGDYVMLTESTLNGKFYGLPIYGLIKNKDKLTQAWLGIKTNEWSSSDVSDVSKLLEKTTYDFGIQFYKDKIQQQIDESNQALQAVEKQQQRFVNQNHDLNGKLEDNKREKIQLEKSLQSNAVEYETLLKRIDNNKKDQDSIAIAKEQIKRIIEMQRERQGKIN